MKLRILRALILLCLGLSGISIGAAEAAQTEGLKITEAGAVQAEEPEVVEVVETDAVEAEEPEAVEVVETDAVEAEEPEAVEAEESGGGGILSSILEWFRGRNVDTASEGKQTQGRQPPREEDGKEVTLSHVYQATLNLIAEIEILRQATGVADNPGEAEPREDQAPIHAYSKSLEVMEKTARVQRRLGMIPIEVGQIPVKNITPQDVPASCITFLSEQAFAPQNTRFWSRRRVWFQFTVGEDKPPMLSVDNRGKGVSSMDCSAKRSPL